MTYWEVLICQAAEVAPLDLVGHVGCKSVMPDINGTQHRTGSHIYGTSLALNQHSAILIPAGSSYQLGKRTGDLNENAVSSKESTLRFVYGSSELNLLHLPFFRNGKDPLEDFDYNDPRCNPLLGPAATRTPSNTTAHQPASCVCLTHFFYTSLNSPFADFEYENCVIDVDKDEANQFELIQCNLYNTWCSNFFVRLSWLLQAAALDHNCSKLILLFVTQIFFYVELLHQLGSPLLNHLGRPLTVLAKLSSARPARASPYRSNVDHSSIFTAICSQSIYYQFFVPACR
ncbi:protein LONGIFOLIA 1 [Dorcoceras hygrometricum]|uniref:Protein LONGIFOLIA 1 n=1 Tax=Dorcoceras hygrometricum TaxID=472368 RepID=A0A2Z7DAJ2_9LAMI|nr:protein LONGIFOLIA 1 [Dorcoceras hygrometricum]